MYMKKVFIIVAACLMYAISAGLRGTYGIMLGSIASSYPSAVLNCKPEDLALTERCNVKSEYDFIWNAVCKNDFD